MLSCINIWGQKQVKDFNFVDIKEGISKVGIYTITQDHYGFIWIGTNGYGLYKFDGIDYTSYKFKYQDSTSISSNLIFSSYLGKDNKLWIGTEDGLNIYDRDLDKFKKINISKSQNSNISVLSINEYDGHLYIGTRLNGLFKYNLETQKTDRIPTKNNNNPAINSIQINKEGIVFLGTSLGLKQLDTAKTEIIKPYLN
jgi:ligand-binding sensor domain-containing protein